MCTISFNSHNISESISIPILQMKKQKGIKET